MPVVDRSYILNITVLSSLSALGILALFPCIEEDEGQKLVKNQLPGSPFS
jgi:hypothetical protein